MPYSEEDAPFFFGRETEREIITANLMASRLTLLYGPSGVGKTSVLRAGVAHHLRQVAQHNLAERGTPEFAVVVFNSWRDNLLDGLADHVEDSVMRALTGQVFEPVPPSCTLGQILQAWAKRVGGELFIILDQFEEYFLYHPQEDGTGTFAVEFPRAVNRPDLHVSFLISIREDSLAKMDRFKGRIPNLFDNYLRIEHLDREAARAAIEKPVEQYNRQRATGEQQVSIEPTLVEAVLEQVRTGQVIVREAGRGVVGVGLTPRETRIETPYLQLVMTRLWEEEMCAGSHTLRLETLNRLGGATQIVKGHLDAVLSALPPREQDTAARVFHHLVTPSGTKVAHTVSDLAEYVGLTEMQVAPVLDKLSSAAIRTLRPIPSGRYEIFHDVLATAILDWQARYVQAQERAETEKQLARERRRVARLRWGLIGLSLLLMVMIALAVFAFRQREIAEHARETAVAAQETADARRVEAAHAKVTAQAERDRALHASLARSLSLREAQAERDRAEYHLRLSTSRELAAAAVDNLDVDPERSILLALEAVSVTYSVDKSVTYQAENALHQAVQASRVRLAISTSQAWGIAFNPDGTRLATAGVDGMARVWDTASGQELLTLSGHTGQVWGVTFSPDGTRLATASADGTAKVWDATSGQELLTLSGHTGAVWGVTFSPDGTRLTTTSGDETAKVWDVTSAQELLTLSGHIDWIRGVTFSPDGTRLATASADGTARMWDTTSGKELLTLSDHTGEIWGVAFSPDGTRLATASADGTARMWDTTSGKGLLTISGPAIAVSNVAFSPDGTRLATARWKTAKVWDATSGQELLALSGHTDAILGIAFSPDGARLATTGEDGTVRVWNISVNQELLTLSGHTDRVRCVTFSPDGTRLATASADETAKVWDAASGQELFTLSGHTHWVEDVAFSPDGKYLATASQDGTTKVWDAALGQELLTLSGHTDWVAGTAFSPDGMHLATASQDETAKVWDATSGQELFTLSGHSGAVWGIAFSPDGTRLATASEDGTAKVWSAASGQELLTLSGHNGWVRDIAFSPDGTCLATASQDETAKVWDATSGQELLTLFGHNDWVRGVAFSPDGMRLATASGDRTAKMWNAYSPYLARRLSHTGSGVEMVKVWNTFPGKELLTLTGHTDWVRSVAFSPDGARLATASEDGTVRIYTLNIAELMVLACSRVTRNLTQAEWETYFGRDVPYRQTCPN
jgi:WD40 repeat protein